MVEVSSYLSEVAAPYEKECSANVWAFINAVVGESQEWLFLRSESGLRSLRCESRDRMREKVDALTGWLMHKRTERAFPESIILEMMVLSAMRRHYLIDSYNLHAFSTPLSIDTTTNFQSGADILVASPIMSNRILSHNPLLLIDVTLGTRTLTPKRDGINFHIKTGVLVLALGQVDIRWCHKLYTPTSFIRKVIRREILEGNFRKTDPIDLNIYREIDLYKRICDIVLERISVLAEALVYIYYQGEHNILTRKSIKICSAVALKRLAYISELWGVRIDVPKEILLMDIDEYNLDRVIGNDCNHVLSRGRIRGRDRQPRHRAANKRHLLDRYWYQDTNF